MSDPLSPGSPTPDRGGDDRLDSWKEIAAYLKRDVTTVRRWERREAMPVHRHLHDKMGSVYAFRTEVDAWAAGRNLSMSAAELASERPSEPVPVPASIAASPTIRHVGRWMLAAAAALVAVALSVLWLRSEPSAVTSLAEANFVQLTDFGGTEQAAAISRDGRFVAFLSDRDGRVDVWMTQPGTGRFYNLTKDAARELVNPSVRTLGFSPDGSLVTFWSRKPDSSNSSGISIWAVPVLGGGVRPYLEGVAEFDWSGDGTRLAYHTPGPGDPLFIQDRDRTTDARQIFAAPAGLHGHFPSWSPDQSFIYFVQGSVPDRMDIWRIKPSGGTPERITHHDATVSHPVFLDARTLAYLASDADGSGPWIYTVDVSRRVPHRTGFGIDRFTSLSASGDGRRLVATVARPRGILWRVPIAAGPVDAAAATRIPLATSSGSSPRFGDGFLLYVSSRGASDSIWKLRQGTSTELWNAPNSRIIGGPAISRDGRQLAFTIRRDGRTQLCVANTDGSAARALTGALEVQGSPSWAPDGTLSVAALVNGTPHLFSVPLDGRPPVSLVAEQSLDPVWSADGQLLMFSGADVGTTFPVKVVTPDGRPTHIPNLMLTRGARSMRFMPGQQSVVVLRGGIDHKDLWLIDLTTGTERQLTRFGAGFDVVDFDLAPGGQELVLEQLQDQSDIVLLEVPVR